MPLSEIAAHHDVLRTNAERLLRLEDVLVAGFGHKADLRPNHFEPAGSLRLPIEAEAIRALMDEQHAQSSTVRRPCRRYWKFR